MSTPFTLTKGLIFRDPRTGPPLPRPRQQKIWPMRNSLDDNKDFINACFQHLPAEGENLRARLATLLSMDWFFEDNLAMNSDAEELVQWFIERTKSNKPRCLFCTTEHVGPAAAVKCVKAHIVPH